MGHARQERVKLVGTRSADYIRASGHCGCIAMGQASTRKQAVYMAAPERFAESQICSCDAGTVHTWPISEATEAACRCSDRGHSFRAGSEVPRRLVTQRDRLSVRIDAARKVYSITSSAILSSDGGTVRPSDLAVLRLMTNSNLVDCITGRSTGFSPLRIRPA
jgi:hypothetical protein